MSITQETIRYNNNITGNTMNLKINLGLHNNFTGYQQEIDNLTSFTTTDLVNPETDAELRRFKLYDDSNLYNTASISFLFYNKITQVHIANFITNDFTPFEISSKTKNITNSFFILDYYDSYNEYNQNKIFRTYLTKITTIPIYTIINTQFYYLNIPVWYIDSITGNTTTGYIKFSFYNAKTGKIVLFYNHDNQSLLTSEKMFFKTELDLVNKTWYIDTPSYPLMKAYELESNALYTNRINATNTTFDNLQQTYPTGNTFNYQFGNYLTT
jgi:hypothetical protein